MYLDLALTGLLWTLLQQPSNQLLAGCEVIERIVDEGILSPIGVFVVKPGIDGGKYGSTPVFRGRHHNIASIAEQRYCGSTQRDRACVLHVEGVRMMKDRPLSHNRNPAIFNVLAEDVMMKNVIEVNAETIRQQIQMRDIGV